MSKNEKELRALRDQQESEVLRRVLFWLGAAVLLETMVLLGNRFFFHYLSTEISLALSLMEVLKVLQYVGFLLGLGFLAWAIAGRKKDAHCGICRIISAAFFASISVCAILFLYIGPACVPILLVGIPSMAGLIMIYYLYQKEFFVLATISGMGILGLWIFRAGSAKYVTFYYVYMLLTIAVSAAVVLLSLQIQKTDGVLLFRGHSLEIVKPTASYKTVWITAALVTASLLLAPILGSVFAYYVFLALIIWIFVMAVYFTSRLM